MTEREKWRDIVVGFLGWYLVTGLLNLLGVFTNFWFFCYTLIALMFFVVFLETRQIALGILAAIAFNFLVSLILGLFENAICFVPFFIK